MSNLLAMSFEGLLAPSFQLEREPGDGRAPDGWGLGFYPGEEPCSLVLKEHVARGRSLESELIKGWDQVASSTFVLHIRQAAWGPVSHANTQPFSRSHGGRDWLFGHAGSLQKSLDFEEPGPFVPVGLTDSEQLFCVLMNRIAERGWRSLADCDLEVVQGWLDALSQYGALDMVLTDGLDLLVFGDPHQSNGLGIWKRSPPFLQRPFGNDRVSVDLFGRGMSSRKGVVVSSDPLFVDEQPVGLEPVAPGELVLIRQGAIRRRVAPRVSGAPARIEVLGPGAQRALSPQRVSVKHSTVYRYKKPVERSVHMLRLTPAINRVQQLVEHRIDVSVPSRSRDFDDVFGNRCRRLIIEEPYTELRVEATSTVDLLNSDPLLYRPLRARRQIPLMWMPWQQQVLTPFMLPTELPESQLHTLTGYAKSFVVRNDFDILETMLDINWSIFKEYEYRPGSTSLHTSAWQVYTNRSGVCQDFTNLFICLARLLNVPARYVCGYIYTGPKNQNQAQSEASHAWVELYLPELGWTGFDPTNGCLAQTEHVRVAVGRNYVDATPTSGTIYLGGGTETLEVDVRVEVVEFLDGTSTPPG